MEKEMEKEKNMKLENDIYNLEKEENLARKCLFLGKKTFLKNEFLQYNI